MIAFKSCPRCRGDLLFTPDDELSCLQCGYELPREEKTRVLQRLAERRSRLAVAA